MAWIIFCLAKKKKHIVYEQIYLIMFENEEQAFMIIIQWRLIKLIYELS